MKWKIYSIQVLSYTAIMMSITYIPRIAKDLGASWIEIALIVGAYNISYFISSMIFGRMADVHGRKLFILVGLAVSTISFFSQFFYRDYYTLLLFRVIAGLSVGIFPAAVISIAHDFGMKMGKLSSWGAIGWAIGSYIAGIIAMIMSLRYTLLASSFFFGVAFIVSIKIKDSDVRINHVPFFPIRIFKKNGVLYISYFLRHSSATMIWTFWVLFVSKIGGNYFWQAATMGINSTTQFFVMYFYTDMGKPKVLVLLGLIFSSITFLSYAFVYNIWLLIPVQILLAFSWSFLYVGTLKYLTEHNKEKATATGLLNSVIGISAAIGPFMGGAIMYVTNSYFDLMISAFLISFVGVLLFLFKFTHDKQENSK